MGKDNVILGELKLKLANKIFQAYVATRQMADLGSIIAQWEKEIEEIEKIIKRVEGKRGD